MTDPEVQSTALHTNDSYDKKLPDADRVYVIDFFSGCGGMSWGFASTRQSHLAYEVLAGVDIDEKALETYELNLGIPTVHRDVRALAERPALLMELLPDFDPKTCRPLVFIGCAPCQGFSAHRKKDDRDDPRNNLMLSFAALCEHYQPDVIAMENVPEILKGRFQKYYSEASTRLADAGYILTQDILDLSLYGVPQRRRRAVILGGLGFKVDLPAPIFTESTAPTVRDAISHLEPIASGETDPQDREHRAPSHTERILERIRKTPPDGGDRRSLAEEDQLDCHLAVDSSDTPGFTDVYGRLRWDTPSVTITAKSSTPSCGRFLHPEQDRNISVREAAILQGFPQSYAFAGPFVNKYRQIGEAVPPLFARFIAWHILSALRPPQRAHAKVELARRSRTKEDMVGDKTEEHILVVDGFSGAGGLALGFEAAGFETAFAFDNDPDAVATFRKNISPSARQISITDEALPTVIDEAVGNCEYVLVGGPPCQGFSQQRRGADEDSRNNLVLHYADLVRRLASPPAAVVLENVTYLDSPRGASILASYVERLEEIGYLVTRHNVNSADFGVPQLRERIFVVALRPPIAEKYEGLKKLTSQRWITVGEAFRSLPDFSDAPLLPSPPNHQPSREGALNKRRIAFVDMGKGRLAIPPQLQLKCHRKYGGHLDVYGRLDWFSQARTITGGFDSFTRGEYGHPLFHRSLTHREGARIQGFPDWFEFAGNRAAVRRQIGNAVPPPLAFALAQAIKVAVAASKPEEMWVS